MTIIVPGLIGFGGGAAAYEADGANCATSAFQKKTSGFTGAANSDSCIISFWMRKLGTWSGDQVVMQDVSTWMDVRVSGDKLNFAFAESTAYKIVCKSTTAMSTTAWQHHIFACRLDGTPEAHYYLDGVEDANITVGPTQGTLTWVRSGWSIFANYNGGQNLGLNVGSADLFDFYFAPGQFLDISVEANRRKFIDALGKPVDLGTDGSKPTGSAPLLFQHLDDGEAASSFTTNRGTGGDVPMGAGSLTTASAGPTD